MAGDYDPFAVGRFPVDVLTQQVPDRARDRLFPCEVWYPHQVEADAPTARRPLVVYSHQAGGNRRSATFLCAHLASHGYVVAAMDHSEVVQPSPSVEGESETSRATRIQRIIADRVPDVLVLLDHLLAGADDLHFDAQRIGLVGHSFGGWTALATPDVDQRVCAVVAMAPGGTSHPKPGILPLRLAFDWGRDVPTLYLAAELDAPIAVEGIQEMFGRTPATKRMFVLKRADHQHFVDDVVGEHELMRSMSHTGDAAWLPAAMLPITQLCSAAAAHTFTRGLALAHLDAHLRHDDAARRFLAGDVQRELTSRGVQAYQA